MLRRLLLRSCSSIASTAIHGDRFLETNPRVHVFTRHFLDLHQVGNKEAIEKEKARLSDELSRGYFADISEMRKSGGKISVANKTIIPSMAAMKFPDLDVCFSDGRGLKLPICSAQTVTDASEVAVSLVCLSFRASSQAMAESWSTPFLDAFSASEKVQLYECLGFSFWSLYLSCSLVKESLLTAKGTLIPLSRAMDFVHILNDTYICVYNIIGRTQVSFIDSWLLTLGPIKKLLLKLMKKSNSPQRQIVYCFGDHYHFRKKLQILNLLTGYIFLLDRLGRVRWQGSGFTTQEELSSLMSCASLLLDDR